jgi:thiol-disulfide isomerase/thioredoxin
VKRLGPLVAGVFALVLCVIFLERRRHVHTASVGPDRGVRMHGSDVVLKDLDGRNVPFGQFRGQVVLVNFWATWCGPCRTEIPWLIELQEKHGPRGFTVLGIAMDDEGTDVVAPFVKQKIFIVDRTPKPINYPIVLGNDAVAEKFGGVIGFPTTVLLSADGRLTKRVDGLLSYEDMDGAIESLLRAAH